MSECRLNKRRESAQNILKLQGDIQEIVLGPIEQINSIKEIKGFTV